MTHYVKAKKHLGQHFLHDQNIAQRIANSIPDNHIPLLEIGPGTGMLTQFLLKRNNTLKVIEIDHESVTWLKENLTELEHHQLMEADFLQANLPSLFSEPYGIVGNFPYNISSQILFRIVENYQDIELLCGMFQKEVAQRIAANHGNKQYGILSVLIQTWYDVKLLFTVSEKAFSPPPKVQSAVLLLTKKTEYHTIEDTKLYVRVVKTAFNQRRKMLRNALQAGFGSKISIPFETQRAEQLSVNDFFTLYKAIKKHTCC